MLSLRIGKYNLGFLCAEFNSLISGVRSKWKVRGDQKSWQAKLKKAFDDGYV